MNRRIIYQISNDYESIYAFLRHKKYPKAIQAYLRSHLDATQVNGIPTMLWKPLPAGSELSIFIEDMDVSHITPVDMDLDIIYEDEDLLVINKPADTAIHPSMNHQEDSLANGVMAYYKKQGLDFCFRVVNRLDRDTSGLVLITKNPYSAAILGNQVREHSLKRTYLCIVEGQIDSSSSFWNMDYVEKNESEDVIAGTISAPIMRKPNSVLERMVSEGGQSAITHFSVLSTNEKYSLLRIRLETGRTHQIRVHMNYIGHPLPGDYLYHPIYDDIKRQSLHSFSLSCIHPVTGESMYWEAPMPMDMQALVTTEKQM